MARESSIWNVSVFKRTKKTLTQSERPLLPKLGKFKIFSAKDHESFMPKRKLLHPRLSRNRDHDFDGVPDAFDCRPKNPMMQDERHDSFAVRAVERMRRFRPTRNYPSPSHQIEASSLVRRLRHEPNSYKKTYTFVRGKTKEPPEYAEGDAYDVAAVVAHKKPAALATAWGSKHLPLKHGRYTNAVIELAKRKGLIVRKHRLDGKYTQYIVSHTKQQNEILRESSDLGDYKINGAVLGYPKSSVQIFHRRVKGTHHEMSERMPAKFRKAIEVHNEQAMHEAEEKEREENDSKE